MTNIELRTTGVYDNLNAAEQKVADYFLAHVEDVFHMTIAQLAEESGSSQVAWVRFSKAIGYDGLKDLKKNLFSELHRTTEEVPVAQPFSDVWKVDSVESLIESTKCNSIQAISDTATLLDPQAVEQAAKKIQSARSVRIFGAGASALVGEDLYSKLLRIDKSAYFSLDQHVQLVYAANMTKDDIAVLISVSGATREVLEMLDHAKENGATTIAITRYNHNPLANSADIVLYISAPEIPLRSGAMSSRIAQLLTVDILFSAVAHFAYDHIAGNLEKSRSSILPHRLEDERGDK